MAVETIAPRIEERIGLPRGAFQLPCAAEPYRLRSLSDLMRPFYPGHYFNLSAALSEFQLSAVPALENVQPDSAAQIASGLARQVTLCDEFGFKASGVTARRLLAMVEKGEPLTGEEIGKAFEEFRGRLCDEMNATVYLSLTLSEGEMYMNPVAGWEDVTARFPEIEEDAVEASKCMALARYTASVFHLMRVAESGLRALVLSLDPACIPSTLRSWDALLTRCDREIEAKRKNRSPEWMAKEEFYTDATAYLRAVCRAWRNKVAHVDQTYTEERARSIYNATKDLMRHLSEEL